MKTRLFQLIALLLTAGLLWSVSALGNGKSPLLTGADAEETLEEILEEEFSSEEQLHAPGSGWLLAEAVIYAGEARIAVILHLQAAAFAAVRYADWMVPLRI